ncbi:MAG: Na/Pi cotransporter family protein [Deltaproteobacteria bacterium]|nr:Na/Pi cotransporter family protein [Deltaproteobacteria bacterium]MBN2673772.1 Na/Pi cotransporter family protein [Deltaproteobacteria bacterium]
MAHDRIHRILLKNNPQLFIAAVAGIGLWSLYASELSAAVPAKSAAAYTSPDMATMILGLLGGLGIFLLGMEFSEHGLKRAAGSKLKNILSVLTANRFMALILGTGVTALLQSSSASTVMLVGFVDSTAMSLTQAIGVTLGAKIGTTVTTQLIAFNLSTYSLALVAIGFFMRIAGKKKGARQFGEVILGFGLIFFGLGLMGDAMRPLRSIPIFTTMVQHLAGMPILGVLISLAFTALVQSSAATIGIAIALCASEVLPLEAALPIAFGAHIGTCATALLASLGTGRAGKQVAVAHLLISIFGVIIAMPLLNQYVASAKWLSSLMGVTSVARELANGHMLFTITTGLVLLAFVPQLKWLTEKLVPSDKEEQNFRPKYLNQTSLDIPELALDLAHREIMRLFTIVRDMLEESMAYLAHPEHEAAEKMDKEDDKVDILEKAIRPYLAKIAQAKLSEALIAREHAFIYLVQDLEGIGDLIAGELARSSKKLDRRHVSFSDEGIVELGRFHAHLLEKFDAINTAVRTLDHQIAQRILDDISQDHALEKELKEAHLERLHGGQKETVETSAYHLSTLNGMRAISERIDNMARTILEELA